jgi:uncharacterized GH25 family protein
MRRLIFVALLCVPATLRAHDFWLEPSNFHPAVGDNVTVSLRVGQQFVGDPVPRVHTLIDAFKATDSAGWRDVSGSENEDPAGYLRIEKKGVTVVSYRSTANRVELPAEKFNQFLAEEGLERIAVLRAKRGESSKPDRERFFRYAKALLLTGNPSSAPARKAIGLRYEIVPDSNPWSSSPFRVRVLFEGKPLRGALIVAIHRDYPQARATARSDAAGRALLKLNRSGVWLVKSVHMVAAAPGTDADWESLWASLTFER